MRLLTENWDLFVFPPLAGVIGKLIVAVMRSGSIPPAFGGYR